MVVWNGCVSSKSMSAYYYHYIYVISNNYVIVVVVVVSLFLGSGFPAVRLQGVKIK